MARPYPAHIFRQLPGVWPRADSVVGNILFIPPGGDRFEADWLICGTPLPRQITSNVPVHRRIFLIQEPPEFWQSSQNVLEQFGHVVSPYPLDCPPSRLTLDVTSGLFWWYGIEMDGHSPAGRFMRFDEILAEPPTPKTRWVSTVMSAKTWLPGHRDRICFTALLKEALGDRLDVFGHPYRPVPDKRDALAGYRYHLAVENAVHPNYWTEKLADALLGRCKVFYHGATEIGRYFSPQAVVPIDIRQADRAVEIIVQELERGARDDSAIEKARESVLRDYNFPVFIDRLIDRLLARERAGEGAWPP
ncbi:MAG: hypothetical protein FGM40_02955 [Rhodocyclaceae bacterium]|nr:hypothetical protein [Rhodocyclaceae bacterium]